MEYEKKYPLTQRPHEYLTLVWERGYKNIRLFQGERLILTVPTAAHVKRGFQYQDSELGKIELTFSEKPMSINVVVDGLHSPANTSHPRKKITGISTYFWIFAAFNLVLVGYSVATREGTFRLNLVTGGGILFFLIYGVLAYFAKQAQSWAVFTGFIIYCLFTVFAILECMVYFALGNCLMALGAIIGLAIRGVLIFLMAGFLKQAVLLIRHNKYNTSNNLLLDDSI